MRGAVADQAEAPPQIAGPVPCTHRPPHCPRQRRRLAAALAALAGAACLWSVCILGPVRAEDSTQHSPAQDSATAREAAPPVRQIAPGFIPLYNLGDPAGATPSGQPAFEVVLPTPDKPLGGCGRSLSKALFNRCLGLTLDLSQRAVEATVIAAQQSIQGRESLAPTHRARWSRILGEVHASWKEARNLECGQLAFLERGPGASIFEERAQCLLQVNRERMADLRRRYGLP